MSFGEHTNAINIMSNSNSKMLFQNDDSDSDSDFDSDSECQLPSFRELQRHLYDIGDHTCQMNKHLQCVHSYKYFCPRCDKGLNGLMSTCNFCHVIDLDDVIPIAPSLNQENSENQVIR